MTHADYVLRRNEPVVLEDWSWECRLCGESVSSYGNPDAAARRAMDHIELAHNGSSETS
jgi:hypothetical protein